MFLACCTTKYTHLAVLVAIKTIKNLLIGRSYSLGMHKEYIFRHSTYQGD